MGETSVEAASGVGSGASRLAGLGASWIIPFYKSPSACTRQVAGRATGAATLLGAVHCSVSLSHRLRFLRASGRARTRDGAIALTAVASVVASFSTLAQDTSGTG